MSRLNLRRIHYIDKDVWTTETSMFHVEHLPSVQPKKIRRL